MIMLDAHRSFVSCFHAFYPTGYLKWACLCNLLASMESNPAAMNYDRLLTAVLDALCNPMIKLRNTFPITYSPETETRCRNFSPTENLSITTSMIQAGDSLSQQFPILSELMNFRSHMDGFRLVCFSKYLAISSVNIQTPTYPRLIHSAVDLKLIFFFAESCEEGDTSVLFIRKEAQRPYRGRYLK